MAWRFSHFVELGELDNTVKGRVTGWIRLAGRREPLRLDLRGDCRPDLAGWRFRIVRNDPASSWAEPVDVSGLSADQTGDVGDITADQLLRHYDCPVEELLARTRAGEPPPTEWRKALYLEWYSHRNGRCVVQDTRLGVQRLGERAFELTDEDLQRKVEKANRELEHLRQQGWIIEEDESGITTFRSIGSGDDDADDLQSYLDRQTDDIDRAIQDSFEDDADTDAGA